MQCVVCSVQCMSPARGVALGVLDQRRDAPVVDGTCNSGSSAHGLWFSL